MAGKFPSHAIEFCLPSSRLELVERGNTLRRQRVSERVVRNIGGRYLRHVLTRRGAMHKERGNARGILERECLVY
jgi:hypothetical protein